VAWLPIHFVAIAGLANRPKNIRIHLAESHVRLYLFRFVSIHLELSATLVRSAPEEPAIRIRTIRPPALFGT
jgi:hypothetical protein